MGTKISKRVYGFVEKCTWIIQAYKNIFHADRQNTDGDYHKDFGKN